MHPRFHIEKLTDGSEIILPEAVARHLNVLGLCTGETVTLFDGSGVEADARLDRISKRAAQATILERRSVSREPHIRVTLACAVPKGRRADGLIRMVAELGVARIVPLITKRSIVRPSAEPGGKGERWEAICISASEQSGRNRIAAVDPPATFEQFLSRDDRDALTVLLSPDDAPTLGEFLAGQWEIEGITLIVGPEGGFTEDELTLARSSGVRFARLTPSILRIETAAVAAVALAVCRLMPSQAAFGREAGTGDRRAVEEIDRS